MSSSSSGSSSSSSSSGGNSSYSGFRFLQEVGRFEILTMSGTIGVDRVHIHISVSTEDGKIRGGHLMENCIVDTTAEITLLVFDDLHFFGEFDDDTGFLELSMERSEG